MMELKKYFDSALSMIDAGNQRLKNRLNQKFMEEIEAAQALIDVGNKKLKSVKDEVTKKD